MDSKPLSEQLTMQLIEQISQKLMRDNSVLTSSGSAALITALHAGNIPLGSEVIMPSICCPAVLFAIQFAGYSPVLADICLDDLCMNAKQAQAVLTAKTKAIVAVHSFGHYCQIDTLESLAKQHKLLLIEDACLAMGGTFKGKPLGSFGDISIMSFGYDKIINVDYGGALVTNNAVIFAQAQDFLHKNQFLQFSPNKSTLNKLIYKLEKLDSFINKRRDNTKYCLNKLNNNHSIQFPEINDVLYWRLPLLVKKHRDELVKQASKKNIIITTHYKSLSQLSTGADDNLPNAQYVSDHIINIFIRPETNQKQLDEIINFINEFYL